MLWSAPPIPVRLTRGEVHLWRARLDREELEVERLGQTLTPDELARASRFRFPEHRARFTAARGILRDILARYLDCEPRALEFGYRPSGKPFLARGSDADLRFNLSHSHDMALYGFASGREIGVDVELARPGRDHMKIAGRFFSPPEIATLQDLPAELRIEAFFRGWTCKEAYLKARGEGLAIPLSSFAVSLIPHEPASLESVRENPGELDRWSLEAFPLAPGYPAAIAVEGRGCRLSFWDWQPLPA